MPVAINFKFFSRFRFAQKATIVLKSTLRGLKTSKWQLFSKSALLWLFKIDLRLAFLSKWNCSKMRKFCAPPKSSWLHASIFTLIHGFYEDSFFILSRNKLIVQQHDQKCVLIEFMLTLLRKMHEFNQEIFLILSHTA